MMHLLKKTMKHLEKQGVDRRTLWAAHDWFHELSHTLGVHDEKEADHFAVKHIKEFIGWRNKKPSVPPIVEKPAEVPPEGGETKFRKTQINSLIQDETLQQQEVAKIVDSKKERYTVFTPRRCC